MEIDSKDGGGATHIGIFLPDQAVDAMAPWLLYGPNKSFLGEGEFACKGKICVSRDFICLFVF